jgi:hypothetical protein
MEEAGHFGRIVRLENGGWQKEQKPLKHRGNGGRENCQQRRNCQKIQID